MNRLDDIIIFDLLTKDSLTKIVDNQIKEVIARLSQKRIALSFANGVREWLAEKGYNPLYGARPLRRTIQDKILTPLASLMVAQGVMEGGTVTISIKNDEPNFEVKKKMTRKTRASFAKAQDDVATSVA